MPDFVVYLRCSTGKQQASGLGIEAQREAVNRYAAQITSSILIEFVETESGAKSDRPELARALAYCRRTKSTLLIARLDRLSRSLAFVAQLLDANVDIRCADMPEANRLLLQMLAVFSEHERQMIRDRTKAALAAAKVRGVKLGTHGRVLAAQNRAQADKFATTLRPRLTEILSERPHTLQSIANRLNTEAVHSPGGNRWYPASVARVLRRLGMSVSASLQ